MKKMMLVLVITFLLIGVVSIGVAAAGRMGLGPARNALNLTPDQQQKILALQQEFRKDTLNLRNDMQKLNLELQQLWQANTLNLNAINAKTNEINTLRVQLIPKQRELMEKMKAVLTPEQQKKVSDKNFGFGPGRMKPRGAGFFNGLGA